MSKFQLEMDEFESLEEGSSDKYRSEAEEMYDDYFDEGEEISFEDLVDTELYVLEHANMTDEELEEAMVKRVTSTGNVSRTRSRAVRKRRATQTTGRSPSQRKRSARKAARTKKRAPSTQRKALRKRRKAMRRRRQMGI